MEGCTIRGPFALGEHSTLKMGTRIYGATTIGTHSKVGGEVSNSVIFGYSNKAHDGFLGNSVIGEWCNLGASTNNSNLKNNYSNVKVWSFAKNNYVDSGLQYCGLFMGDHSKSGINTMFNTGTVTGVCCNIFGGDFPPKDIPSFFWGGSNGFEVFKLNKAIELAAQVFKRRNMEFDEKEIAIINYLYDEMENGKLTIQNSKKPPINIVP
jgi:UDP-N-acetylglucosamine diphosphorylase/glucosamine-1-phosphate N-acetyltransferase